MRNMASRHKISAFTSREKKKKRFSSFRELLTNKHGLSSEKKDFVACFVLDFFSVCFFLVK